jgi:hypothetical protein
MARIASSFAAERESARTVYPAAMSRGTVARPMTPVAPVTKTVDMVFSFRRLIVGE